MQFPTICILLLIIPQFLGQEPSGRIFNGLEAPEDDFPSMVSLRFHDQEQINRITDVCGGSIISDIFVLTAASCFFGAHMFPHVFSVRAGIHDISHDNDDREQIRSISHVIVHPNYMSGNLLNDLALVRVTPAFNLKAINVNTIPLSNLTSVENIDLVATGWGVVNQSDPAVTATILQQVTVQEDIACTQNQTINSTTQLCAPGTCRRDSGGPLMIFSNDTNNYELVGVTSYRDSCVTNGLFTRVAPFIGWIMAILDNPPPTPRPITTTIRTTTTTGRPTEFICDTRNSCGCSSVPVIFHDGPPTSIQHKSQGRIVGGEPAQPYSWPWVVSIRFLGSHNCGGSLINNEWILTAAHCLLTIISTVHIGVHDRLLPSPVVRNISTIILHPDFVAPPQHINDIALVRLSSPIDFDMPNIHAGVTCLPPQSNDLNYPEADIRLAVIGWGLLSENGSQPRELQQVRVTTLATDDRRCINATYDKQRQFCAMVDGGGKDACQGDSGGPIHQWLGDHWEQVGLVSYGTGCAREAHPGMYTRLSFYHDWIFATIKQIDETTSTSSASTLSTTITDSTSSLHTTSATPVSTLETTTDGATKDPNNNAATVTSKIFFVLIISILLNFFLF